MSLSFLDFIDLLFYDVSDISKSLSNAAPREADLFEIAVPRLMNLLIFDIAGFLY
jgi:hypothetical protein